MNTNQHEPTLTSSGSTLIDVSAVSFSALCLIHCLAIPVLGAILPAGIAWFESEWVHRLAVMATLPISGYAIRTSLIAREGLVFSIAATTGLTLLMCAAFVEPLHDVETSLTVFGALILAFSHIARWSSNRRKRSSCLPKSA